MVFETRLQHTWLKDRLILIWQYNIFTLSPCLSLMSLMVSVDVVKALWLTLSPFSKWQNGLYSLKKTFKCYVFVESSGLTLNVCTCFVLKLALLLTVCAFGSCFRTLAVFLVLVVVFLFSLSPSYHFMFKTLCWNPEVVMCSQLDIEIQELKPVSGQ